jgi:hypothetical protein
MMMMMIDIDILGQLYGLIPNEHLLELSITLPLRCLSRICLIKTLLEKNSLGKNSSEGKRIQHLLCVNCLIKNLTRKTQWDKTMVKGKRVQNIFVSPPHKDNYI